GQIRWQNRCVGKGSVTYADGHLYVRGERGDVALVEATPNEYREKGRFSQPDRSDKNAWAHPVISAGRLYLRDHDRMLCYQLK
ncbi:MAG: polyvinylalcohol dehydrogenase, partial [Rhodopirellula sp. JB044]